MMRLPPRNLGVTRRQPRIPPDRVPQNRAPRDRVPQSRAQQDRFPDTRAPQNRTPQDWRDRSRSYRNIPPPPDGFRGREMRGRHFDDFTLPVHGDATIAERGTSRYGFVFALAAVILIVSGFAAFSLISRLGSQNGPNGPALEAVASPTEAPYTGLVATATIYALTPTVTTGPRTPTPTPRPSVPTPTPVLIPTATSVPNTPTPTATPTPHPTLSVTPPSPRPFTCGSLGDTLTVANTGDAGSTLNWSVSSTDTSVTFSQTSGSTTVGTPTMLVVSGAPTASFTVIFTSNGVGGGGLNVQYTC
jgi:hypothetical protein